MATGEHDKALAALTDLYERANGAELSRDDRRLVKHYRRVIDEHLAKAGAPATPGLLQHDHERSN